jgi:hypothetical protein
LVIKKMFGVYQAEGGLRREKIIPEVSDLF